MGLFSKVKSVVGLDIGSSAIKAVELKAGKGGSFQLLNLASEPLAPEAIVDGTILDAAVVIDTIATPFNDNKIKHADCATAVSGNAVIIDGYNVLITVEACLSRAPIFLARDGCFRDLAGIHGSYRKVTETIGAIELIAANLQSLGICHALWLFDSPVSNSGRLKTIIYELVEKNSWPWDVELLQNPDTELAKTDKIIITADSDVLDKCSRWINLTGYIIGRMADANIVDLSV